jgi:glycosyltransferase involved in cell wall biosynthesis
LRLVFLGNIVHPPNRDGLIYFIEHILPLLRQSDPQARFDVIGTCETGLAERYASEATFRGFVPNLAEALSAYDVFVAPIRYGSGTRMKLLDAMASHIPIVTTRAGAAGLPIVHGQHALLAETPSAFVESIRSIKRDPALANNLVREGAGLIERSFRSAAIQTDLSRWLEGLIVQPKEPFASQLVQ